MPLDRTTCHLLQVVLRTRSPERQFSLDKTNCSATGVSVSTYVQENKIATDKAAPGSLKSMDVVLGGNHGQGKVQIDNQDHSTR
jgi:hypothetical protein